ncbi:MAG: hypothetical protein M1816_000243 [Peltula sp. TS41687]|nr:MAG: hypothetical protein M1816_000243 [Peltula sp. TS41687]
MNALHRLVVRDDPNSKDDSLRSTIVRLTIVLVVLITVIGMLVVALFAVRSRRRAKQNAILPMYDERSSSMSNPRRLTVTAAPYGRKNQSIHVYNEKQNLVENSSSPPFSPTSIPEIRVTFPEERDQSGRRKSGAVVIVRVGETGLGLEPFVEEPLPPYPRSDAERFHSIDLERIGGLKER